MTKLTSNEERYCRAIETKLEALERHLQSNALSQPINARVWLFHLSGIKSALGNINNDMSFVASLLIKEFLEAEYGCVDFDAARKPQGAAGPDVVATAADGSTIVGELKTTTPYQMGFGAAQRLSILKDLDRLASSVADHRLMFVVDPDSFDTLCHHNSFAFRAPGVRVVDLITGASHTCIARQVATSA